ncbi:MAG: 3-deoxy-D-manno-octulosonic acid transferase [Elusimicrobia bacterium]|nr:3-deoxy-D-manno-octulosonic acid transferase [Elusimicrobiota bacterium]
MTAWMATYNLFYLPALAAVLTGFFFSKRRKMLGRWREEIVERLFPPVELIRQKAGNRPLLWMHAASVGEVHAAKGLLRALKKKRPETFILLSTTTRSGKEAAAKIAEAEWVLLFPLDFYPALSRLLRLRVKLLLLVETELWPNLIFLARRRGAAIAVVNGRLSERSFPRYRRARFFLSALLGRIDLFCVQEPADAERFIALGAGAERTRPVGNLKYDAAPQDSPEITGLIDNKLSRLGWSAAEDPIFLAGSTHPEEEGDVLRGYLAAQRRFPRLKLVLAPRHLDRLAETLAYLEACGVSWTLWDGAGGESPRCLVVNRLGLLSVLYGRARIAFVGGTLADRGGHNLLEPAQKGIPVMFGPHTSNVPQISRRLVEAGGGMQVTNGQEIGARLVEALADPGGLARQGAAARRAAASFQGAVERTLLELEPFLNSPRPEATLPRTAGHAP